jgi:hypothetical protein
VTRGTGHTRLAGKAGYGPTRRRQYQANAGGKYTEHQAAKSDHKKHPFARSYKNSRELIVGDAARI